MSQQLLFEDLPRQRTPYAFEGTSVFLGERRPNRGNKYVRKAAARAFTPSLQAWIGEPGREEETANDLFDVAQWGYLDGFRLAKELEAKGYIADTDLVDLMEDFIGLLDDVTRQAVRTWVASNDIRPSRALGETVTILTWNDSGQRCSYRGIISEVREADARYLVRVPELGHVESGLGCHGFVIDAEDIPDDEAQAA